ncbi:MAG: glycoside hydrolase family 3 C-terminal domain-containing protein [Firmicutes bacterium]|nr:glycoside hydrolase family 3 C-terminal domain-containing protein [Bacillota bacterium]
MSEVMRRAAAEGCVLLKNDGVLPLAEGSVVAVFGRTAWDTIYSGTGSGGLVHPPYKTSIITGLERSGRVTVHSGMKSLYETWLSSHPFDSGCGWATEPWYQAEFVPDEGEVAAAAEKSDAAVIVIGRQAGEDRDNAPERGSYYLTEDEDALISVVTRYFEHTALILNTGNIIDMTRGADVGALLCVWQGGQDCGDAVADILTGKASPSGKLTDTVAVRIEDYPSDKNFGRGDADIYEEDIYVGYRFFETFAKGSVLYPFGFGLSYTTFDICVTGAESDGSCVSFTVNVKNTGDFAGREVVEIYAETPQEPLGAPARALLAFAKTKTLAPGECETLTIGAELLHIASYDETGRTGNKSCFVLPAGEYKFYVGGDVRAAKEAYSLTLESTVVTERCTEALSPRREFSRIKPALRENGEYEASYEPVPTAGYDYAERVSARKIPEAGYRGDMGIGFSDAADGVASVDDFTAEMTDGELCALLRGEGLGSPKVKVWTTAVFGGITEGASRLGVPISTNSDGPSGVRSDAGERATLAPCGTLLASTFDTELVTEVMSVIGREVTEHGLDALLGPGMNIHRHPLCGRNFEYFSEDPYLTGKIAAACCRGISSAGAAATPKHFAANGRERGRSYTDAVMSERAAREIYLRGFEILIKTGYARSIMTSYNLINGVHSASNYDLITTILRGEWGFDGLVMTDWSAYMNADVGGEFSPRDLASMVRAGGDVYMVVESAEQNPDNLIPSLSDGSLTRGDIEASARRIIKFIAESRKK